MKPIPYIWFNADHSQLYIDPAISNLSIPIFKDIIVDITRAIANNEQNESIKGYGTQKPVDQTIYHKLIGMRFGEYYSQPRSIPWRDIYEFEFSLNSGRIVCNLGNGLLTENTSTDFINSTLSILLHKPINVNEWEAQRFYSIENGALKPTKHVTDNAIGYLVELRAPEILGL